MYHPESVDLLGLTVPCALVDTPRRPRGLYLALRPLVEGLGLNWKTQLLKVNKCPSISKEIRQIRMKAKDRKSRMMVSIPERIVFKWLNMVDFKAISDDDISKRIKYFQYICKYPDLVDSSDVIYSARLFFFGSSLKEVPVSSQEKALLTPYLDDRSPASPDERTRGILQTFLEYHRRQNELARYMMPAA